MELSGTSRSPWQYCAGGSLGLTGGAVPSLGLSGGDSDTESELGFSREGSEFAGSGIALFSELNKLNIFGIN